MSIRFTIGNGTTHIAGQSIISGRIRPPDEFWSFGEVHQCRADLGLYKYMNQEKKTKKKCFFSDGILRQPW
jgi:hypothetical protein